jgi:hypothetical protein
MVRRLFFFGLGLLFGAAVGGAIAMLLAPASGKEMRQRVEDHFESAVREAQKASDARRREMETQLQAFTSVNGKQPSNRPYSPPPPYSRNGNGSNGHYHNGGNGANGANGSNGSNGYRQPAPVAKKRTLFSR